MTRREKRRQLARNNGFNKNDAKKILCQDSSFSVKEAYNAIRTNLLFLQQSVLRRIRSRRMPLLCSILPGLPGRPKVWFWNIKTCAISATGTGSIIP